jgi:hypothetical protein
MFRYVNENRLFLIPPFSLLVLFRISILSTVHLCTNEPKPDLTSCNSHINYEGGGVGEENIFIVSRILFNVHCTFATPLVQFSVPLIPKCLHEFP